MRPQGDWGAIIGNGAFGQIRVVEMLKPDGSVAYRAPIWSQKRGEVVCTVNDQFQIAMVEQLRPVVLNPALYADQWDELGIIDPFSPEFIEQQGMTLLEMVRGYTQTLGDEAREETRYDIEKVAVIGHHNTDTANMVTSPFVVVAKGTSRPSGMAPDPNEQIKRVVWVPAKETREMNTICGFTHGVLHQVRSWALKQDDPFWRELGERL